VSINVYLSVYSSGRGGAVTNEDCGVIDLTEDDVDIPIVKTSSSSAAPGASVKRKSVQRSSSGSGSVQKNNHKKPPGGSADLCWGEWMFRKLGNVN